MPRLLARRLAGAGALVAGLVLAFAIARSSAGVWTEDHNHDGRPDVWRVYDARGRLSSVAFDTNFDGRSDVREYYDFGTLVRREADRDYNDRVDFVQEFDTSTLQAVRSVEDTDADGAADVLVLFQDGQPVFTKTWSRGVSHAAAPVPLRHGDDRLASIEDPFRAETCLRSNGLSPASVDGSEIINGALPMPSASIGPLLAGVELLRPLAASRPDDLTVACDRSRAPPIA
jgi:hypothetical protein